MGKIYQMTTNYTKLPHIMINGHKISQMIIKKIKTFSIPRPSNIYPNWDFWFEYKPSGNPG
jgi:hypothetical protein